MASESETLDIRKKGRHPSRRDTPAMGGLVDCDHVAKKSNGLTTQVLAFLSDYPTHLSGAADAPAMIEVSAERETAVAIPTSPAAARDTTVGEGRHGGRQRSRTTTSGDYDPLFESLGPDDWETIKCLLVFVEIGFGFQNGMQSLRQIGKWLTQRQLEERQPHYPMNLPATAPSVCRCSEKVAEFFGAQLGLGANPPLFKSSGNGKATFGLTDLGRDLWLRTHRYLIGRGFIPQHS